MLRKSVTLFCIQCIVNCKIALLISDVLLSRLHRIKTTILNGNERAVNVEHGLSDYLQASSSQTICPHQ